MSGYGPGYLKQSAHTKTPPGSMRQIVIFMLLCSLKVAYVNIPRNHETGA